MSDITDITLDQLWSADRPPEPLPFDPASIAHLPGPARRYLGHAIAPGTPLYRAVRLKQEGEIRLGEKWLPFTAEQVMPWERGFIWQARAKMGLLSVKGSDRLIDGEGAMRWKLLGLIPVMTARGPDIARSAAARLQAESMWLPSVLLGERVRWEAHDEQHLSVSLSVQGFETRIALTLDEGGRMLECSLPRWGNPDGGEFGEHVFGSFLDGETTFDGYTIPTALRAGWHFGSERFESEGEFWRAQITSVEYR